MVTGQELVSGIGRADASCHSEMQTGKAESEDFTEFRSLHNVLQRVI